MRLRKARIVRSPAEWLIWRSTGVFGDFKMSVCTRIVKLEPRLSDDEYEKIIARYHDHCSHWNIPYEIIARELAEFATAAGRNGKDVFRNYWDKLGQIFCSTMSRRR